jgi:hypothetical protein
VAHGANGVRRANHCAKRVHQAVRQERDDVHRPALVRGFAAQTHGT